ncbi:MAG: GNAT family N-acetyltransferase [Herbaspirillum sp.]
MRVVRGRVDSIDLKALAAEIIAINCDVAIVRVPSHCASRIAGLARWALPVLHADTLVHYQCDLTRLEAKPLRNGDLIFALASEADLPQLREMIAITFRDYASHYQANPLFGAEKILAGYQQWAENHLTDPDCDLWTARRGSRLVAFAACRNDLHRGESEGILYGVSPQAAGGGLYGDLIRYTQAEAKSRGLSVMKVSTQVGNFAVQKVWAREGFYLFEALDTFHINALLFSGETAIDRTVTFDSHTVRKFSEVSGDANPIHLDDVAARAAGFPMRIAHGAMAASEFSRILGTEVPGPGTVFGNLQLAFLQPLLVDHPYHLQMRIPGGIRAGAMKAVMTIRSLESGGGLCVLARSDIFLRH